MGSAPLRPRSLHPHRSRRGSWRGHSIKKFNLFRVFLGPAVRPRAWPRCTVVEHSSGRSPSGPRHGSKRSANRTQPGTDGRERVVGQSAFC
ncbi:hypothetical protein VTH06DRAFT_6154 [Thermothelomyces fergusii]